MRTLQRLWPVTLIAVVGCSSEDTSGADGSGSDGGIPGAEGDAESSGSMSNGNTTAETADGSEGTQTGIATSASSSDEGTTGSATDSTSSGGSGDSESDAGSSTGAPTQMCECAPGLDDGIFVLSDDAELWKFIPSDLSFEMVGDVACDGQNSTFSMAVDRLGFAWIMFQNDAIWKVDITDTTNCVDPGYVPGQMGVNKFGMAFVSQSLQDPCDRLYGNTWNGQGGFGEGEDIGTFLSVDPQDGTLSTIGPTDYNGAELTGTQDGRTFLFAGSPGKLIEVDKATGQELDSTELGLNLTNAFAFAFFEGDFYFFTEANNNASRVDHLDPDTGEIDRIVQTAPIRVVGAGVSTCVSVVPQ